MSTPKPNNDKWADISTALIRDGAKIKIKATLLVKDFMRPIRGLTRYDSLRKAADLVVNERLDGVPIVDNEGYLVGLVTKTGLLRELLNGTDPETPLQEFMLRYVLTTSAEDSVGGLIKTSTSNLPVVENGKVVGLINLADTIRAYFSSVIALREQMHTIFDSVGNGILTVNDEGLIIQINPAAEEFLQLARSDVIRHPVEDFLPETRLREVMQTRKGEVLQKWSYKDKIFISNQTPIINNGEVIGAVAVFQDISALELVSEELSSTKRIKEELDTIIESSFDGVHISDENGQTLQVNEAFIRITGANREDIRNKYIEDLLADDFNNQSIAAMVQNCREPVTISKKSVLGSVVWITANPVFDAQGNIFRIVTNVRDVTELNQLKRQLDQSQNLSQHYQAKLKQAKLKEKYVIRSQQSRDLLDLCTRLGRVDTTVLVLGESGAGKEIAAQIIHSNSSRSSIPLISINCAAIPESLLETELFGYTGGAFTGASKNGKPGIFEMAHEGTLFLDEIGELPLNLQSKLLRVVQEQELTRVGGTKPIHVNVRLISATNRDLSEMVERKEFRKDLYYRLNVVQVVVAPLRERKSEIPFFVHHFLRIFNHKYSLNKRIAEPVMRDLIDYDWPGNIRELENLIERVIVTYPEDTIRTINLPNKINNQEESAQMDIFTGYRLKPALEKLEKHLIQNALNTYGSTRKVASELGVSQPTIVRKSAKYNIALQD